MALFAFTSERPEINGTDYSDHCRSAVLVVDAAQLDATDFASGGWTEVQGGLKSGTLTLNFHDDIADNDIDEDLWAILGTVVTFKLRGTSASVGTGNPEYQGNTLVTSHSFGGDVGALANKSLTWPTSGAITRATSA